MASSRSGGAAVMVAEMEKMSVEQLRAVKEQADLELNLLQDSLNNVRTATTRLELASTALQDLSLRPQGKKMLVPLTASLYVPGTLDDSDKVLVDVGTGYFIETVDKTAEWTSTGKICYFGKRMMGFYVMAPALYSFEILPKNCI